MLTRPSQGPSLILGTRDSNGKEVPFKSRYGNKLTGLVFHFLYGVRICDTQTGLRMILCGAPERCV